MDKLRLYSETKERGFLQNRSACLFLAQTIASRLRNKQFGPGPPVLDFEMKVAEDPAGCKFNRIGDVI